MGRDLVVASLSLGLLGFGAGFGICRKFFNEASGGDESGAWEHRKKYLIGIDIGGTAVKLGIITCAGDIVVNHQEYIQDASFDGVVKLIEKLVQKCLEESGLCLERDVVGAGVGIPGFIDSEHGEVTFAANFPTWPRDAPLAQRLQHVLDVRPRIENDANTALLAEVWIGAASRSNDVVMLTLGTGVGSAMVCDGKLLRGSCGKAGEVGHMIIQVDGRPSPNTGVNGIVEEYVSARSVGVIAQERAASSKSNSKLKQLESVTCKDVFDLAKQGDPLSVEIVEETFDLLGVICINMVRVFDTSTIIIGGGMIAAGQFLLDGIKKRFRHHHWTLNTPTCDVRLAQLGTTSGMIGAAYLAHPLKRIQ
uniref:Glucokinase n=1 Tax=Mucochytrium quahogii TaxID=96639 RepID=A0A7S2RJX9_9STRA|mmetsp:Transcript_1572/g.2431  ORF Transcript_1572/g.2431 Transcript_1572/m.2431 type:complete len:364 (-) Transcript_1572:1002-2093(-)|eukprot:CAMPEP_0203778418 /NCGR_PEP_ID=MMETSP0099_2-20121227/7985_1 /ASSEMBLY_ACC=CAM_ASM_000209 /TAXON_ID=96639 /ORGANISM=" , Strain NY0313808BC1" /LENGTH=363 /DNA_ID=CAMNT_0050677923 /DNA_START=530 /DNA_END=1621 /DNA_ORIENTATION=-